MEILDIESMSVADLVAHTRSKPHSFLEIDMPGVDDRVYIVVAVGDGADLLAGVLNDALRDDEGNFDGMG